MFSDDELEKIQSWIEESDSLVKIISVNSSLVRLLFKRTVFARLIFSAHASSSAGGGFGVEVQSRTIDGLTLKKVKDQLQSLQKQQQDGLLPLLEFLKKLVLKSLLLVCGDEVAAIREEMTEMGPDAVKLNDTKGLVYLSMRSGSHWLKVKFSVPSDYPESIANFTVLKSSLPQVLQEGLSRRLTAISGDLARPNFVYRSPAQIVAERFAARRKAAAASGGGPGTDPDRPVWQPNKDELAELKHDKRFLAKVQQLREVGEDDKSARRRQRRLEKAEAQREQLLLQNADGDSSVGQQQQQQQQRSNVVQNSDLLRENFLSDSRRPPVIISPASADGENATQSNCSEALDGYSDDVTLPKTVRSLLPLVQTCHSMFVKLVRGKCSCCSAPLLSEPRLTNQKPSSLTVSAGQGPVLSLGCGCYFHRPCLQLFAETPPFSDKRCPRCNDPFLSVVFDKDFLMKHEQRYHARQRAERELEEISDFLS